VTLAPVWCRVERDDVLQRRRGRRQEHGVFAQRAAERRERAEQRVTRLVDVSADKRRILYVEGEPRWEYKFIRRAEDGDHGIQIVSMLRTTENKIYRQGIADPSELADGFPAKAEDLFKYQAIIIGSVEAGYFTPVQQELLREFVDKRGGGLLFLGGRFALSEGGWPASSLADLFPTFLPRKRARSIAMPRRCSSPPPAPKFPSRGCSTTARKMSIAGTSCRISPTTRSSARRSPGRLCSPK